MNTMKLTTTAIVALLFCSAAQAVVEKKVLNNTVNQGPKYLLDSAFSKRTNDSTSTVKRVYKWHSPDVWVCGSTQICTHTISFTSQIAYAVGVDYTIKYTIADFGGFDLKQSFTKTTTNSTTESGTYNQPKNSVGMGVRYIQRTLSSGHWNGAWVWVREDYKCYDPTDCFHEDYWDVYQQDLNIQVATYNNAWIQTGSPAVAFVTWPGSNTAIPAQYAIGQ